MTKLITKISVEAIGTSYQVVVINSHREKMILTPPAPLQLALTEAAEFGDFFGVTPTQFRDENRRLVEPQIRRDTYSPNRKRNAEQLLADYRQKTGELNWNKVMHYEWNRFRQPSGFKDKEMMKEWLMPHYVEGPVSIEWLTENCKGCWLASKGGYRFSDDRDATLYKLFFRGNRD